MSRQEAMLNLKSELLHRRKAIRAALKGDLTYLQELSLPSGDLADFAQDSTYEEMTSQLAEVERGELEQIEEALARFEQGSFGSCAGCDKSIPLARLEALPYARLCIACQIKLEKSGFSDWSRLAEDAYDSV